MTEHGTGLRVIEAFIEGDAAAAIAALAVDAVFQSPVADYHGREQIAPVLHALASVVTDGVRVSAHTNAEETVVFFTAMVEGRHADAMLRVIAEADAPATQLTLMIRPLGSLLAGIGAMQDALAAAPQPPSAFPTSKAKP